MGIRLPRKEKKKLKKAFGDNAFEVWLKKNKALSQREEIVSRWAKAGLLDGLAGSKSVTVAQLLENQANSMISEVCEDSSHKDEGVVLLPIAVGAFAHPLTIKAVGDEWDDDTTSEEG